MVDRAGRCLQREYFEPQVNAYPDLLPDKFIFNFDFDSCARAQ